MGKIVWLTLAGVFIGLLLVHPVAMLAYAAGHYHPSGPVNLTFGLNLFRQAFGPGVVHMGLFFALLGGISGLILGFWFREKQRLVRETIECQRSLASLETSRELMVTLAHYIRNANMVIGGFSSRLLRQCPDPQLQEELHLIQEAAEEIDAVIAALQNLTQISTVEYTTDSHALMIDLKKDLEALLAKAHQPEDQAKNGGDSSS